MVMDIRKWSNSTATMTMPDRFRQYDPIATGFLPPKETR